MSLREQLAQTTSHLARAALFRAALLEAGCSRAAVAKACKVTPSMVSNVITGKTAGGVKARKVQDFVAEKLGEDPDLLFPDRGPPTKGGGFHAQKRNWQGPKSEGLA